MTMGWYSRLNFLSIFFVFMLFVFGGLVRATGSGMGCPDWPKCFGSYIPPSSESELPQDYEQQFLKKRMEKTERFVKLLNVFGFEEQAEKIRSAKELDENHSFNVAKAYTEYANRLWGALTGIIVLLCLIASIPYFRKDFQLFLFTMLGFLAVVLNALIGAVVVNANLLGSIVTVHFIAAFASLSFFVLARNRLHRFNSNFSYPNSVKWLSILSLLLIFIQVIYGATVRELFEELQTIHVTDLQTKIELLGIAFVIHRVLPVLLFLIFGIQALLLIRMQKSNQSTRKWAIFLPIILLFQIVFGSLILTNHLPAISKLFHISLGATLFLIQLYICNLVFRKPKIN
jgi:cytochrome c oxidase assembly protein subunit 15